jgi:hypothetical protein
MNFIESYLDKNQFSPRIAEPPANNLGIIIVIPCFNEPDIINTLLSLYQCKKTNCTTEVIIVINHAKNSQPGIIHRNEETLEEVNQWIKFHTSEHLHFYTMFIPDMPLKHAGVGLARKTGMDEAVYRFNLLQKTGIIAGFDADSICEPNYLIEIQNHFAQNTKTPGASIYFEHPINDVTPSSQLEQGIIQYELHLRYLNQCLRFIGHPHAFQTIGSSFAVRSDAYVKQGGMNKRQAGEDFYFLQKIISLGNYSEINTTTIIPSSRISDRVPFGTGAALKKWSDTDCSQLVTYNFSAFLMLKDFFLMLDKIYTATSTEIPLLLKNIDSTLLNFLEHNQYIDNIQIIKQNTTTLQSFKSRFFKWCNVFMLIKFLNSTKDSKIVQQNIQKATNELLKHIHPGMPEISSTTELLMLMRKIEKGEFTNTTN